MRVYGREAFAAQRRGDQDEMEKTLFPYVATALQHYPAEGWYNELLAEVGRQYLATFHTEGGKGQPKPSSADFVAEVRTTLDKTENPTDATTDRISVWLSTAILNAGTQAAAATDEEFLVMEWVTMHDDVVRAAHRETDGQQRPPGEPYDVAGTEMRYPGDPTAPIELWINCRCTLAPVLGTEAARGGTSPMTQTTTANSATSITYNGDPTQQAEKEPITAGDPVPWHGVLAPEGAWSGDGRRFLPNSLTHRDLPMPLAWQKFTEPGHDGGVTVAKIETIERVGSEMQASGHFLQTPEADEVIGLLSEFGKFGISVDADNAEYTFDDDEGHRHSYSAARISAAAIVAIPAFAEAYICLGEWPDANTGGGVEMAMPSDQVDVCDESSPDYDPEACRAQQGYAEVEAKDYDAEARKKAHTQPGTDGSYPIEDCADLKNAIQAIGRSKDPAATKKHIKSQKARLGCPDVSIPEGWDAEAEEFGETMGRGPGWITNPEATRRIHNYWTKKGQPGYAKINWGVPGDFNRCRIQVGEEIGENSPEKLGFINQICAQWHHDALGFWPGRPTGSETEAFADVDPAPALSIVASATPDTRPPFEWFTDPLLERATALTVTEEGRVFGHIAEWGTCHVGYGDTCEEPPKSLTQYAYFRTGEVLTDSGAVPVGCLTIGGGHAAGGLSPRPALAHYDDVATAWADVACGEDEHGIWVAGYVRPGTTPDMVVAARASKPSGDWRRIAGNLEMIAVHQVNTGGFPIPRVTISNGVQVALVAAGVLRDEPETGTATVRLDPDLFADAMAQAMVEIEKRKKTMAALVARVHKVGAEHASEEG